MTELLYHGSPKDFTEFNPSAGGAEGFGVYLTPLVERATNYAGDDGLIYEVDASKALEMKGLSQDEITLSREDMAGILTELSNRQIEEDEYPTTLSDYYGEISDFEDKDYLNSVINDVAEDLLMSNDSDTFVINDLKNAMGDEKMMGEILSSQNVGYTIDASLNKESPDILVFDPTNVVIKQKSLTQDLIQDLGIELER